MAEEASKLRGLEARVAALETKFNFLLQFIRRLTEREEEKKKATISKRQKEIYPALSLSKAAQTLPTPRRPAFHIPRPSRTEPRQFQPLPIPVPQLYTLLVKKKMITPVSQRTRIGPQPKDYNKDLTCEYHQGEVGHTVENCRVLRHRIQDLLDQGVLKFRIEGVINTIGAEKDDEVDITSTKIPWEPLFHELKKRGLLTAPRAPKESTEAGTCQYHPGARDHNLQGCEEFKKEVASLITKGLIRRKGEQPERDCMTIDQLRLSPYEKTNFQARMERIKEDFEEFCEKKKEELGKLTPLEMSKPDPVVIHYATKEKVMLQTASVSAVQSSEKVPSVVIQVPSGRCYTPEELEKRRKEAGKAVEDPTKTKAVEEEASDFLRIIKEKALLKVLNEAYVPEDITGPSFENMVTSILVTNQLTFSDDELPPEGRGHIKALYISVKTNDRIVSRVLIDNGSALNVCLLSTLEKLDIDPTRVRVTSMVVRAFDGTRREVLGEIDLPVEIGPQVYDINFQVLRIDSPYNLLLGRPCLFGRQRLRKDSLRPMLQLGPRAKTLRQEVHFSYHTQLSDHQELLRSSRNLSQKMTPWHKEHSDGLRSQDHILRTQARLCARPVPLEKVFLTRNKLICEPGHVGKKTHSCTTWNSRIAKNFIGVSRNPDRKTALKRTKNTSGGLCSREPYLTSPSSDFRKSGTLQKITTPATSWNSRFAESIPRLIGIFTGKVHENSSDTPTSGSHNSSHPNSDSCKLYTVGKRTSRAFRRYACMTHFEFQKTFQNCPRKSGQKENTRARIEEVQTAVSGGVHARRATITRRARSWRAPRARPPINKASPPPHLHTVFARALGLFER
uniref:Retrotransposon gag domain-containing protein n=1 Tax=Fagus sylvatica TaxID=28930 RepID=A0A2N9GC03_FAGSY